MAAVEQCRSDTQLLTRHGRGWCAGLVIVPPFVCSLKKLMMHDDQHSVCLSLEEVLSDHDTVNTRSPFFISFILYFPFSIFFVTYNI